MATALGRATASPNPASWIYALSAVAWVALLFTAGDGAHTHHAPAPSASAVFGSWALMVVAMMTPFAAPGAAWAARGGLRRLRVYAPALYLAGFVSGWVAFALAAAGLQIAFQPWVASPLVVAVAAGVAAVWQGRRVRHRAMDGCGRAVPIPARGRAWAAGTARAGAMHGLWCVATCWAAMVIMVPLHHPAAMAGLFAVQVHERRRGPNPFAIRRWRTGAAIYAAIAAASLLAALST